MKFQRAQLVLVALLSTQINVYANNFDRFTYDKTDEDNDEYGPEDWKKVSCDDPGRCEGFPDGWETAIGWDLEDTKAGCEICVNNNIKNNNCKWCPADEPDCGQHRQSPIDLNRDRGLWTHPNKKECPDWHFMKYQDGACKWKDFVDNDDSIYQNNFLIQRHALQILTPVDDDGELQCFDDDLGARYPRLDYSKGFPRWWHLAHTEISVPSEHTQEGKRYDAEVTLAHFYEEAHYRNQLGKVVVFLEAYDDVEPWPFLDKLICQWRETEEKTRKECGKDSASTYYPGCVNYKRGHTPMPTAKETAAPVTGAPTLAPITNSPVTAAPVTSAPSFTTRTANNTLFYPKCMICGGNKTITKSDPIVNLPSFPPMDCGRFESAGMYGMIRPSFCTIIPAFTSQCGCVENTESIPSTNKISPVPTTSAPAPMTSAPVPTTSAPTSAPNTPAPLDTSPILTSVPGTMTPETAVPGTAMPETTAPVTAAPNTSQPAVPAPFDCPSFEDVDTGIDLNYKRICEKGGCCDSTRSATNFCHDAYSFFDELMASVCHWCCGDEGPKELAAPPPVHPDFDPIDCSKIDRPNRICDPNEENSCCGERSDTSYCKSKYEQFPGGMMDSICWYCCETPQLLEPEPETRKLRLGSNNEKPGPVQQKKRPLRNSPQDEERREALRHSNADARMNHLNVQPEDNMKPLFDPLVEDGLFKERLARFLKNEDVTRDEDERRRRRLVNYEDVEYSPYEWLVKVDTEYYYRYEGTQAVPPCKDQVHWRVMKDPIRIARRQLEELERLQAERIAPVGSRFRECKGDHAGKRRKDEEGNTIEGKFDFARPVQAPHKLHRKVFCECKDWKSKFPADQSWCARTIFNRFYEHPYNFETGGVW